MLRLIINIDGGARGNPGPAAAGVVIRDAADGKELSAQGIYLGRATNNVAEYRGLLVGLQKALDLGAAEVQVFSDSELMVRQINGLYRVKSDSLRTLFEQARNMLAKFTKAEIRHLPRRDNAHADALVNKALNLKRNVAD